MKPGKRVSGVRKKAGFQMLEQNPVRTGLVAGQDNDPSIFAAPAYW
jgi:hypothetical protein